jgi:hypothetical protein
VNPFMKIQALLSILALFCAQLVVADGRLSPRFRTVFILQMENGLDQHLANRLTANRALWVVLEPKNADAVLTPALDDSFWSWLGRNYPSAAGTPVPPANTAANPAQYGAASKKDPQGNSTREGMVFLVDPRTRVVLWSAWEKPAKPTAADLDYTAGRIAGQIKAAFEKK